MAWLIRVVRLIWFYLVVFLFHSTDWARFDGFHQIWLDVARLSSIGFCDAIDLVVSIWYMWLVSLVGGSDSIDLNYVIPSIDLFDLTDLIWFGWLDWRGWVGWFEWVNWVDWVDWVDWFDLTPAIWLSWLIHLDLSFVETPRPNFDLSAWFDGFHWSDWLVWFNVIDLIGVGRHEWHGGFDWFNWSDLIGSVRLIRPAGLMGLIWFGLFWFVCVDHIDSTHLFNMIRSGAIWRNSISFALPDLIRSDWFDRLIWFDRHARGTRETFFRYLLAQHFLKVGLFFWVALTPPFYRTEQNSLKNGRFDGT